MEKRDMIEVLVSYYCGGNKAKFAAKLGIKPQALSMWISRNSFDAELIYKNCEDVSAEWLLSGEGDMLNKTEQSVVASGNGIAVAGNNTIAGNNNAVGNVTMGDNTAVLQERVTMLEKLLEEKERTIKILMER